MRRKGDKMKIVPKRSSNRDPAQKFFENIDNKLKALNTLATEVNSNGLEKDPSAMIPGLSPMYDDQNTAKQISELPEAKKKETEYIRGLIGNNVTNIFKGKNS